MKRWILAAFALGAFAVIPGTVAFPLVAVVVSRWRARNRVTLIEVRTRTAPLTKFAPAQRLRFVHPRACVTL